MLGKWLAINSNDNMMLIAHCRHCNVSQCQSTRCHCVDSGLYIKHGNWWHQLRQASLLLQQIFWRHRYVTT